MGTEDLAGIVRPSGCASFIDRVAIGSSFACLICSLSESMNISALGRTTGFVSNSSIVVEAAKLHVASGTALTKFTSTMPEVAELVHFWVKRVPNACIWSSMRSFNVIPGRELLGILPPVAEVM